MGFKSFLSRSSRRNKSTEADVENNNNKASAQLSSSNHINMKNASAPNMNHKRNQSSRLVAGLQNVLNAHRRSKTAGPARGSIILPMASAPASPAPAPSSKKLYSFQPRKHKQADPIPSPPSTADATAIESDTTLLSSPQTYSTPPSTTLTPASTAEYKESGPRIELGPRVVAASHDEVNAVLPVFTKARIDAPTTAAIEEHVDDYRLGEKMSPPTAVETGPTASDTYANEMKAALAEMRAAEKLLMERHATLREPLQKALQKPKANTSIKRKPNGLATGKTGETAPLPVKITAHRRKQSRTANEAIEDLQRRQAVKDLAFFAADGCPTNQDILDLINVHLTLNGRHVDGDTPEVTFDIHGVKVLASQLSPGTVEHNWITRYNVVVQTATYVERRLMNLEDHEMILTQLFPQERAHIMKPEHFEIFMDGLGEEGILTKSQASAIAKVQVITEEFDKGAHFTGPSVDRYAHRRNPTAIALFDIPKQAHRPMISYSPRPTKLVNQQELYYKLRILVEAAAYGQNFWKGYFFPSAASKLDDFYNAWKEAQDGWLLPPHLTEYARDWTHKEVRLLQRGHMICELLKKYETGEVTDFGVIRAVRATMINIPAQPFWCAEDLESFLYHRITGSGLAVADISDILILHPDHDTATANARLRATLYEALQERVQLFEKEEQERLSAIDESYVTFEMQMKAEMSRWERVKGGWKKIVGRKEVVVPFDPFAPEHEVVE